MNELSIFEQAGIEVKQQGTISNIFKETGLDWEVEQQPVFAEEYHGKHNRLPLVANYRSDTNKYLGVVNPKNYKVVQNIEAFNFIDELPNFTFEKVGEFGNGKKVFVVGKSNDQIDIDGSGDLVNFYLTFLHGHDGKSGIRFILSPVRMFCMNQLNLMLEAATFKYNIAHTGNIEFKLAQIQNYIKDSRNYVRKLELETKRMINTSPNMTIEEFTSQLVKDTDKDSKLVLSRKEETREAIIDLYKNKDDLQNYKNTSFGFISAVSDFISHKEPGRKLSGVTENSLISNLEGNPLLIDAYNLLKVV